MYILVYSNMVNWRIRSIESTFGLILSPSKFHEAFLSFIWQNKGKVHVFTLANHRRGRHAIRWTNRNSSTCRDCSASAGKHLRATSNNWFLFHYERGTSFLANEKFSKTRQIQYCNTLHAQLPKLYSSRYSTTFYKTKNHQMSVQ